MGQSTSGENQKKRNHVPVGLKDHTGRETAGLNAFNRRPTRSFFLPSCGRTPAVEPSALPS